MSLWIIPAIVVAVFLFHAIWGALAGALGWQIDEHDPFAIKDPVPPDDE